MWRVWTNAVIKSPTAAAMGNWMMFSLLFRNLRIPLAEGLMVWPPDGLASPAAQR